MAKKLCENVIVVRVQFVGCFMRYKVNGFKQISSIELLYRYCKASNMGGGNGFEENRDVAFEEVEKGVVRATIASGTGFYAVSYELVYMLGQCEGDLNTDDCGECVRTTLERVKVECKLAITGQVYLHQWRGCREGDEGGKELYGKGLQWEGKQEKEEGNMGRKRGNILMKKIDG
ncbi:hypothetical protein Ancab_023208 [Ancistrocladus abbreviatus]